MRTETQAYPVLSQAESGGGGRGEVGAGGVEDLAAELVFVAIAVVEIGGLNLGYAARRSSRTARLAMGSQ